MKKSSSYLLSLPERTLRSVTALAAGLIREGSEITLPPAFRRTRIYQSIVDQTLRFFIENIGRVEGAYEAQGTLENDFLVRRTAGNGIEWVSLAVFHASPVWVLAAMADVTGAGNKVLTEIALTLEKEGWLTGASNVRTITDLLDGLERGSSHLAETFNTPPLNRAALLKEWASLKAVMQATPADQVERDWHLLQQTAARQSKPLMEVSTAVALNTLRLGKRLVTDSILNHYVTTLSELNQIGFPAFAEREMAPYWRAAVKHFTQ